MRGVDEDSLRTEVDTLREASQGMGDGDGFDQAAGLEQPGCSDKMFRSVALSRKG